MTNQQNQAEKFIDSIYKSFDGFSIKFAAEKQYQKKETDNLLYGETLLETAKELINLANVKGGVFFDLGSGTGLLPKL